MRFIVATLVAVATLLVINISATVAHARTGSPRLDKAERGLIRAINQQRAHVGLRKVRASRRLNRAADYHSHEMLYGNYFAHSSADGSPMSQRLHLFTSSRNVGETLAMLGGRCGRRLGSRVVNMWMASSTHRAVLTTANFRRVGVARRSGSLSGSRSCMVTADFASRR
jgi:uncharacterized protein YkwD